jgi:2-amino-4-hydroxy-6-hydroxymethyldihydropteridine diphosphokinase
MLKSIQTKKQDSTAFGKLSILTDSSPVLSVSSEKDFNDLINHLENNKPKSSISPLKTVYLLLGSNLGNRKGILDKALELLNQKVGKIISQSKDYETKPWGVTEQPDFLNLAIAIHTNLNPQEILEETQAIENQLGRVRKEKWGARLIDIDLMFYENDIIDEPNLKIPHPLMQERDFAMTPLSEIAPDLVHPVLGKTVLELRNLLLERR